MRHSIGARGLADARDLTGIPAERLDVLVYPVECSDEIEQAEVGGPLRRAVAQESEHPEPKGDGDDDHILFGDQHGRIVVGFVAGAEHV